MRTRVKRPKQESLWRRRTRAGTVSEEPAAPAGPGPAGLAPDTPKRYHNCEICVVRNEGKRPEGYVEPPLE